MSNFNYVVKDELGIHARPAGLIVKEAKKYGCSIKMKKGEKEADLSRLMMLMALGVKKGDKVSVSVEGENEQEVAAKLLAFFEENL